MSKSKLESLFVNYKIASKLREHKFNEPCLGLYAFKQLEISRANIQSTDKDFLLAPTYDQVVNWLETKGLFAEAVWVETLTERYYKARVRNRKQEWSGTNGVGYENRKQALKEAVKLAINYL